MHERARRLNIIGGCGIHQAKVEYVQSRQRIHCWLPITSCPCAWLTSLNRGWATKTRSKEITPVDLDPGGRFCRYDKRRPMRTISRCMKHTRCPILARVNKRERRVNWVENGIKRNKSDNSREDSTKRLIDLM